MTATVASLEDSEEPFLTLSQEVASSFLYLYLDGDKAKSDIITRSPAQERAGDKTAAEKDGPPPVAENDVAIQIAMRLKTIGDDMNVQMKKHWGEVIAELFQQHTVFDIGIDQFKTMCRRVLDRSSASVRSGWEQVALIYIGMGNIVQELRRQNPQDQSQRERQLQGFAGQFMQDVGLDRWIVRQGGMRNIGNLPDSSYPAVVEISGSQVD